MKVSRVKAVASAETIRPTDPSVSERAEDYDRRRRSRRRLLIGALVALLIIAAAVSQTSPVKVMYLRYRLLNYQAEAKRVVWHEGAIGAQDLLEKSNYARVVTGNDSIVRFAPKHFRNAVTQVTGHDDSFIYQIMRTPRGVPRLVQLRFAQTVIASKDTLRTLELRVITLPGIGNPARVISQRIPLGRVSYPSSSHLQIFEGRPQFPDFTTCLIDYELNRRPGQVSLRLTDEDTVVVDSWVGPVAFGLEESKPAGSP